MNRFFRATPEIYEAIRTSMDAASGYPNEETATWFVPASESIKDSEGNCLIAAIAPIAEQFVAAGAEELPAEEYTALIPPPEEEL
jgi:hypothetical protein